MANVYIMSYYIIKYIPHYALCTVIQIGLLVFEIIKHEHIGN